MQEIEAKLIILFRYLNVELINVTNQCNKALANVRQAFIYQCQKEINAYIYIYIRQVLDVNKTVDSQVFSIFVVLTFRSLHVFYFKGADFGVQ